VTALAEAVRRNRASVAQALIEHKSDINQRVFGDSLINQAFTNGKQCIQVLRVLLAAKPALNVNELNRKGSSPLHVAARVWQPDTVTLLMQAGADPRLRGSDGETALMQARDAETVRRLVQAAPDTVNMQSNNGQTAALLLCANPDMVDVMEALFRCAEEYGCPVDVSTEDGNGDTALHVAMVASNLPAVRLLLEKGAGARGSRYEGMTVLMRPFLSEADRQARFLWYKSMVIVNAIIRLCRRGPQGQLGAEDGEADDEADEDEEDDWDEFDDEDDDDGEDELGGGNDAVGNGSYNPEEDTRARECVEAVIASILRGGVSGKKRKAVVEDDEEKETDAKRTKRW
jgi:hypothetical protein